MDNILISLFIVIYILIQRFENNIANEKLKQTISSWHFVVKKHFCQIVKTQYSNASRKTLGNWFSLMFILVALINFISIIVFGNNTENAFLNNRVMFFGVGAVIVLMLGFTSEKGDLFFLSFIAFLIGIAIPYFVFSKISHFNFSKDFILK